MTKAQKDRERRYECIVCCFPSLRMVAGACQHRVCEKCLYDDQTKVIKENLFKCPICQRWDVFPICRPDIPEDNINIQRILGVVECPYGCGAEMWKWEKHSHCRTCPKRPVAKRKGTSPSPKKTNQLEKSRDKPGIQAPIAMRTRRRTSGIGGTSPSSKSKR